MIVKWTVIVLYKLLMIVWRQKFNMLKETKWRLLLLLKNLNGEGWAYVDLPIFLFLHFWF